MCTQLAITSMERDVRTSVNHKTRKNNTQPSTVNTKTHWQFCFPNFNTMSSETCWTPLVSQSKFIINKTNKQINQIKENDLRHLTYIHSQHSLVVKPTIFTRSYTYRDRDTEEPRCHISWISQAVWHASRVTVLTSSAGLHHTVTAQLTYFTLSHTVVEQLSWPVSHCHTLLWNSSAGLCHIVTRCCGTAQLTYVTRCCGTAQLICVTLSHAVVEQLSWPVSHFHSSADLCHIVTRCCGTAQLACVTLSHAVVEQLSWSVSYCHMLLWNSSAGLCHIVTHCCGTARLACVTLSHAVVEQLSWPVSHAVVEQLSWPLSHAVVEQLSWPVS